MANEYIKKLIEQMKSNSGGEAKSLVSDILRLKLRERLKEKRKEISNKILNK